MTQSKIRFSSNNYYTHQGFPGGTSGKESQSAGDTRHEGLIPGLGRSPAGGNDNPLQYSCLENTHGQRTLAGYSPQGRKESDTTEATEKACVADTRCGTAETITTM